MGRHKDGQSVVGGLEGRRSELSSVAALTWGARSNAAPAVLCFADIEDSLRVGLGDLQPGMIAAFAPIDEEPEQLCVALEPQQELVRSDADGPAWPEVGELAQRIRAVVGHAHGIEVGELFLVAPGAIPRTCGGKPQRLLFRDQLSEGSIVPLAVWRGAHQSSPALVQPIVTDALLETAVPSKRALLFLSQVPEKDLEAELVGLGWEFNQVSKIEQLEAALGEHTSHVLIEVCEKEYSVADVVQTVRLRAHGAAIVVCTAFPIVGEVGGMLRMGAKAVLPKPVTGQQILWAFGESVSWYPSSLEQIRRKYVEEILYLVGSVSAAANVLGVDRRSLRRMLARFAEEATPGSPIAEWSRRRDAHVESRRTRLASEEYD